MRTPIHRRQFTRGLLAAGGLSFLPGAARARSFGSLIVTVQDMGPADLLRLKVTSEYDGFTLVGHTLPDMRLPRDGRFESVQSSVPSGAVTGRAAHMGHYFALHLRLASFTGEKLDTSWNVALFTGSRLLTITG